MVGLKDVAAAAGVSMSVASRVLNGDHGARISATTRQRVLEVAGRLAYVPSHRSRALRSSRSGAIALVVPNVTNSVFTELLHGVTDASAQHGASVLLGQLGTPPRVSPRGPLADLVGRDRVDGVILQRREDVDDAALRAVLNVDVPVVLFNSTITRHVGSVILDDVTAARIAVEHLLRLGHRRIALIGGDKRHDAARRRERGFRDALHAAGLRIPRELIVAAGWEAPAGRAAMKQLLTRPNMPTGVVVASVNAGAGAASEAGRAGVAIPEQLSLVCLQDAWYAEAFNPALTVVRMPLRAAGRAATDMLLANLDGKPMSDVVITSPAPRLVPRASTAAPRR